MEHVTHADRLTAEQRDFVMDHIRDCSHCCDLYDALCDLEGAIREAKREAAGIPKPNMYLTCTAKDAFAQDWQRVQALELAKRTSRRWVQAFRIAGLIAASVVLAVSIGWTVIYKSKSGQLQPSTAVTSASPAALAELVTPEGHEPLALNQPVVTNEQPQEILLGGMHRVVMNYNTTATFSAEPQQTEGAHIGKTLYIIQLAQGELYVEVEPGNPFTVLTPNACLEITGTQFDVVADGGKTKLTLLKGSVRFSSPGHPHEAVNVTAGHFSTVVGLQHVPTAPTHTDALAATAWAHDITLHNTIAHNQNKHANDLDLQAFMAMSRSLYHYQAPPDVDTEDYDAWLKAHPQPRVVPATLAAMRAQDSIDANWIELLMISGDIWQFHCDPKRSFDRPLTQVEPAAIARLAHHYGLDEKDILKTLRLPEPTLTAMMSAQGAPPGQRYTEALRHWHDAILSAVPVDDKPDAHGDLILFSLTAGHYLAETRTAAYLWVKNNPEKACQLLADKAYLAMLPTPPTPFAAAAEGAPDVNAWLKQLRVEANAARSLAPAALDWLINEPDTICPGQLSEQQTKVATFIEELLTAAEVNKQ